MVRDLVQRLGESLVKNKLYEYQSILEFSLAKLVYREKYIINPH
jgi:hypothetical protein